MKRISLTTASTDAFFVTICAVATLHCTNHAKPFGPELQVKQMLCGLPVATFVKSKNPKHIFESFVE
jgi:hypothetical protein